MLTTLRIENVVLIETLEIDFRKGLCALTGETGAGKSILLDSLGLAIGARADSGLVRKGTDKAQVSATFEVSQKHPAFAVLEEAGITIEQGEDIILRRSLTSDGRSKAFINDQSVSAGLMRTVGDMLIEIHGQFDTQGLLNPSTHREMLDEYANIPLVPLSAWNAWQEAISAAEALKERTSASKTEEAYLREALEDLDKLEPQAGEEQELAGLRERLMSREQVLEGLNHAYHALNGEQDPVRSAWGTLERISDKMGAEGAPIIDALERASSEIQDAVASIQSLSADLTESEHDLQSIDDRLFGLRAQARKHNCEVDELPQIREQLAQQLNEIEHADDALADAVKKVEQAKTAYETEAKAIHDQRKSAAMKLDGLVAQELPPLKLEKARFETHIDILDEQEWGPHGMDRVRFLVATNPGAEAGPLNKIASGGEMSRFMLALKVVMAEVGAADTLIFDEVDAGIGGGTADAVGERLGRLAADKQILVVTHAPQVAARAGHHWIVKKDGDEDVRTSIEPLEDAQKRREEIARMLAGATITEEARAAANKLLEVSVAA